MILSLVGLPIALALTGCSSFLISHRKLPVPIAPATVQTASADQLAARLNEEWSKFESMTATVEIQASRLKAKEGVATDYPTFRANLLLRKPDMIRVLGHLPIVQTKMFDMASDGKTFTLVIPPKDLAYKGQSNSKGTSPNWYENLRPGPLFDSMVVRGLDPEDLYSVISETITEEDKVSKRLRLEPEYILNIVRRKANSQELYPVRVIHFHREDLLPYQQDMYDDQGTLATQVIYGAYKDFDGTKYPSTVTLKQPLYDYELTMSVVRVAYNTTAVTNEMFQESVPDGYKKIDLK
jgi:hypothetical protein